MAKAPKTKGVPVEYMDLQTLWNDRRDPHANPMSSSPRRMEARCHPGNLGGLVDQIYSGPPSGRDVDDPTERRR
jgi:hypothetical protein